MVVLTSNETASSEVTSSEVLEESYSQNPMTFPHPNGRQVHLEPQEEYQLVSESYLVA